MDTKRLISRFENIIRQLEGIYKTFSDEYFFTEKELYSYFYHLCLSDGSFSLNGEFNLIHTEYPTPFKCSKEKESPYFMIRPTDSAYVRSHVDLVLLNPNFIEWIKKYDKPYEYIKGLRNELFSNYIREFVSRYSEFYHETKETVLLYALGFNYFRVGYEGAKYPLLDIKQDVEKLKSVKSFKIGSFMYDELHFSRKILSLVFVGDKSKKILARDLHDDPVVKLISK